MKSQTRLYIECNNILSEYRRSKYDWSSYFLNPDIYKYGPRESEVCCQKLLHSKLIEILR